MAETDTEPFIGVVTKFKKNWCWAKVIAEEEEQKAGSKRFNDENVEKGK